MDYTTEYASPIGKILLASDGTALIGLWFIDQKHFGATLQQPVLDGTSLPILQKTVLWLDAYWRGEKPAPETLALAPRGTPFQQQIWHLLLQIPYGETTTYGSLAKQYLERNELPSMSAQAVGNAVGRNPISIIIPCHRVVGANTALTGYAGGMHRKEALLSHEGRSSPKF